MYIVRDYLTRDGRDVFRDWFRKLRDRKAKESVQRRIARVQQGNFGDHKYCGQGIWELRIDYGPGYRIYYAVEDNQIVLLLCAGDKGSQRSDINLASSYWTDWKGRANER